MSDGAEIIPGKETGQMGSCQQEDHIMKSFFKRFLIFFSVLIFTTGFNASCQSPFTFTEKNQGIELFENGRPVYFYQQEPKSIDKKYICNNYLHPLFSIDGDTLTEEFPADHPYHRGIYWAWHQIYIDNQSLGDGWIMENISEEVTQIHSEILNKLARLNLEVKWKSPIYKDGKPFMSENTTIWVHQLTGEIRLIDFEIRLNALVPGISIGGSDDEKGYGGFCARIKLPENLIFTSSTGPVIPQTLQIKAGPWMDFSGSFGKTDKINGITILCHPSTPNWPEPWILRQVTSMQNIVFPGRNRIGIPPDKPVILRYRIVVHNGSAGKIDIEKLQEDYNKYSYPYSGPQIR
jgi:hypothetical protein